MVDPKLCSTSRLAAGGTIFFAAISLSMALSSIASAKSLFSLVFSFSSAGPYDAIRDGGAA
jgi:hypothetical protein